MDSSTQSNVTREYHLLSKHRPNGYAPGPEEADWSSQPSAFRQFAGAPFVELPLSAGQFERPANALPEKDFPSPASLESLGALLQLSFAISAWKRSGRLQWAVRCNPSSGNLHPIEVYVIASGWPGLQDAVYHYDALRHGLELRAALPANSLPPGLHVAFSSILWREAWKYGERAFRYCLLDSGHALGALIQAGGVFGWPIVAVPVASERLIHFLGLDRLEDFAPEDDFRGTEQPEMLLHVGATPAPSRTEWLRGFERALQSASWHGRATTIGPSSNVVWPEAYRAARASVFPERNPVEPNRAHSPLPPSFLLQCTAGRTAILLGRRSAQRFDPENSMMPRDRFYRILDATLPRSDGRWTAAPARPRIHFAIIVLRVEDLLPGVYLLPRHPEAHALFPRGLGPAVSDEDSSCPAHLDLRRLETTASENWPAFAHKISCHQAIAADGAFTLAMLGEFNAALTNGPAATPWGYRELHQEAGFIGQTLYVEAELAGFRGTGLGCFFDDEMINRLGIRGTDLQTIYHFTIGRPAGDDRISSVAPYLKRKAKSQK